jgi:hypothetical protein
VSTTPQAEINVNISITMRLPMPAAAAPPESEPEHLAAEPAAEAAGPRDTAAIFEQVLKDALGQVPGIKLGRIRVNNAPDDPECDCPRCRLIRMLKS